MQEITITILTGVLSILSVIATLIFIVMAKRGKEKAAQLRKDYSNRFNEVWNNYYKEIEPRLAGKTMVRYVISAPSASVAFSTKADIETKVNEKINEIKGRVERIEKRFPKEATLEKITSVNDAILATNFEALSESVKKIEEKLLTKWDIAKIVFAILGALGVLTTILLAILK